MPIRNAKLNLRNRLHLYASLMILATVVLLGGCKTKKLPSQFVFRNIQVDGKSADWSGLSLTHFEDDGFSVGIANDTSRLYLMMRTHDGSIVRTIRMTGMQLWLNSEGDKEPGFGVRFRGGPSFGMSVLSQMREDMMPPGVDQKQMSSVDRPKRLKDTTLIFTFVDEKQLIDLDIPTDGSLGPAVAIDTSEGFYTYEFSIPLQKSEVRFFGLGASADREIAVGVMWGEIDRKEMGERMDGMRGGLTGGGPPMGGGMSGGGPKGSGPPRGMGKRPEIKTVDLWFRTTLADQ